MRSPRTRPQTPRSGAILVRAVDRHGAELPHIPFPACVKGIQLLLEQVPFGEGVGQMASELGIEEPAGGVRAHLKTLGCEPGGAVEYLGHVGVSQFKFAFEGPIKTPGFFAAFNFGGGVVVGQCCFH